MLTIVLGLAAACLYSLFNLFSQRLLRSMSWMTITVAMFVTGLVLLGVPALVVDGLPFADDQFGDLGLAGARRPALHAAPQGPSCSLCAWASSRSSSCSPASTGPSPRRSRSPWARS